MRAMDIRINGKRRCTIGVGTSGVLSSIVRWVDIPAEGKSSRADEFGISAGGLVVKGKRQTHYVWLNEALVLGDEVTIKLVESCKVDRPKSRKARTPNNQIQPIAAKHGSG
jgi:hypothetical protein